MLNRLKELLLERICPRRLGPEQAGSVLLTFDDGPHPRITPAVLERLARYDVRAVFFVVGCRIVTASELLRRIAAAGHIIGNHSFRHEHGRRLGFRGYRADLHQCQTAIREETGQSPLLFRPPFGERTATTLLAARSLGLRPVTWSLDPEDWRCRSPEAALPTAERLIERVRPRDVVLLHDDHEGVLTILDRLLPALTERGLDLASGAAGMVRDGRPAIELWQHR